MSSKVCSKCKQDKPLDQYHRLRGSTQSYCKECKKEVDQKRIKSGIKNLNQYLKDRCNHMCDHCGQKFDREVLEFHHPFGVVKTMGLESSRWRGLTGPKPEVVAEADQCLVLCANCHRIEHVRIKNEGSDTGHRDRRSETNEGLGDCNEGCSDQRGFDSEESNP